jgi:hypothetical protein
MSSNVIINKKFFFIENQLNKKFKLKQEDFLFLKVIPKMEMNIQFENPVPFLVKPKMEVYKT